MRPYTRPLAWAGLGRPFRADEHDRAEKAIESGGKSGLGRLLTPVSCPHAFQKCKVHPEMLMKIKDGEK
jgi:hypothetical protein